MVGKGVGDGVVLDPGRALEESAAVTRSLERRIDVTFASKLREKCQAPDAGEPRLQFLVPRVPGQVQSLDQFRNVGSGIFLSRIYAVGVRGPVRPVRDIRRLSAPFGSTLSATH